MKQEKSCGCIIVDDQKVLLISSKDDNGNIFWSFPKGHQEEGETDFETAIRETKEETNLDVEIIDDKPIVTSHLVKNGTANKTVLLFLSKPVTKNQRIQVQEDEVQSIEWVNFIKADKYLDNNFSHYKESWQEAKRRIGI